MKLAIHIHLFYHRVNSIQVFENIHLYPILNTAASLGGCRPCCWPGHERGQEHNIRIRARTHYTWESWTAEYQPEEA